MTREEFDRLLLWHWEKHLRSLGEDLVDPEEVPGDEDHELVGWDALMFGPAQYEELRRMLAPDLEDPHDVGQFEFQSKYGKVTIMKDARVEPGDVMRAEWFRMGEQTEPMVLKRKKHGRTPY